MRGLCVGGDMVILFFGHCTEFSENRPRPKKSRKSKEFLGIPKKIENPKKS